MLPIPTALLRISHVPGHDTDWDAISHFALTFDGYEWAGGIKKLGDLAHSTRQRYGSSPVRQLPMLTLDELRACLFLEQRRYNHLGSPPKGADLVYVHALVQAIREWLTKEAETGVCSDVVMFCLSAIQKFSGMSSNEIQGCLAEILIMQGTKGISVNSADKRYTLKLMEGTFSGLQLVCYVYVGVKRIGAQIDMGFDLSEEYEAAPRLSKQA